MANPFNVLIKLIHPRHNRMELDAHIGHNQKVVEGVKYTGVIGVKLNLGHGFRIRPTIDEH